MIWAPFTRSRRRLFAIVVYNSNKLIDDNLEIFLNDTSIGSIDNNQNAFTGRIFIEPRGLTKMTSSNVVLRRQDSGLGEGPIIPNAQLQFQSNVSLDMSLLKNGSNVFRIERIQNNNGGNFGRFVIGYWTALSDGLYYPTFRLWDDLYFGASGDSGTLYQHTFTYP